MFGKTKKNDNYLYFFNKIYDQSGSVFGFESLLRIKDTSGEWVLPQDFDKISLEIIKEAVIKSKENLPQGNFKFILKLTSKQLLSYRLRKIIKEVSAQIAPMVLVIELSHNEIRKKPKKVRAIKRRILRYQKQGVYFSINNIGSEFSHAKIIHKLLPYIDFIKLDMKYFNKEKSWLDLTLKFWGKLTKKYQIELIVSEVETKADAELVDLLGINLRQGFLYGKPQMQIK